MRIAFILPGHGTRPAGGFKVVYEYANGLVKRGHAVTVIHTPYQKTGECSPTALLRRFLVYAGRSLGMGGGYRPDGWFDVDPRVILKWVPVPSGRWITDADAVVATSWETSEWTCRYGCSKGRKFYLLQHDERVFDADYSMRVADSWRFPMHKIVVARWLKELMYDIGQPCDHVPNGIDFHAFNLDSPIHNRDHLRLMMLHHTAGWKGSADGLRALAIAHETFPHLKATVYGVGRRPADLPTWMEYHQQPCQSDLRFLYNDCAIFISPSHSEGWGLPGAEAMACGAALVSTDNGGVRDYAEHEKTALLSPPKDPEALARNVMRLIRDDALRISLAEEGHLHIQQFTWSRAVDAFESCISGVGI